jgi:hypothetical protein
MAWVALTLNNARAGSVLVLEAFPPAPRCVC